MMNIIQVKVTYLIPSELGSFRLVSTYHVSYLAPPQIQSLYPTKSSRERICHNLYLWKHKDAYSISIMLYAIFISCYFKKKLKTLDFYTYKDIANFDAFQLNCLSSTIIEIGSSELVIHICTYRFGDFFTRIVYRKKLEYPQHWRCCRTIYIYEDDCLLKPICQWIKKNHKMPIVFLWSRSKLLDLGSIINEAKDENVTMNGIFIELFFCLFNLELSFIKKIGAFETNNIY